VTTLPGRPLSVFHERTKNFGAAGSAVADGRFEPKTTDVKTQTHGKPGAPKLRLLRKSAAKFFKAGQQLNMTGFWPPRKPRASQTGPDFQ